MFITCVYDSKFEFAFVLQVSDSKLKVTVLYPSDSVIKVIGRTVCRNNHVRCLFIFILPLHVMALAGHLQAEYNIIFVKLPHYNGSVVLCYRSYFVYGLANIAVVCLICENVNC
jgi:hypothetical protein